MTPTLTVVDAYLHECYRPDREYVDGEVVERAMGEKEHAAWQIAVCRLLSGFRAKADVRPFAELRLQIGPDRYRVPDVMVISRDAPDEQVISHPPLLCVEVLSPEDRFGRINERLADYARMGVGNVWILDPGKRLGYQCSGPAFAVWTEVPILSVRDTPILIAMSELLADLD